MNVKKLRENHSTWIEENSNYPEGFGNLFLMRHRLDENCKLKLECIGGADNFDGEWVVKLIVPCFSPEEPDCEIIAKVNTQEEAVNVLWCHRGNVYF